MPLMLFQPASSNNKKSQSWNYGNLKPDDGQDDEKEEDDERVFPKASFTCGEQQNLVAVFLFDLRANGCTCQLNSFLSSGKNVVVTSHSFAIKKPASFSQSDTFLSFLIICTTFSLQKNTEPITNCCNCKKREN